MEENYLPELKKLAEALNYQEHYEEKVSEAAEYVKKIMGDFKPIFALTLGSGLGKLAKSISVITTIPYSSIPNFPTTTVPGHEGMMLIGELEGVPMIGMKGRKHYYEVADHPFNTGILQAVFPIHVLASLGIKNYFATNASGGLNSKYVVGNLMIIKSHVNLIPNPLLGRHHNFTNMETNSRIMRFQPMNDEYDPELRSLLKEASEDYKECVHEGVYIAVSGPSYETMAENVAFRDGLKADAVGMSTAPEVVVARSRGMKVVALSCISDICAEDGSDAVNHEQVQAILESQECSTRLSSIVQNFFSLYKAKFC